MNKNIQILIDQLIDNKITMVSNNRFQTIIRHYNNINKIPGDIIECGCWRGGFSIFLSHLFENKHIWVCDSFCGFQPLKKAKYTYDGNERHTENFVNTADGPIGVPIEDVKNNFEKYGTPITSEENRVSLVKGFVNETLPNLPVEKIALLRIDVDSYSATLECLDNLYGKVSEGGYIVFDDSCLHETVDAIKMFFKRENIENCIYDTDTDEKLDLELYGETTKIWPKCGCYIKK